MFDILYQSEARFVKYQALIVSKFETTKHNVIYCFIDPKDYEQYDLKFDQVSKNVNVMGNIIGCKVWTLFTRSPEGFIRVEFRSNGVNVQQVAAKYGGGGHRCAAGLRLEGWTWKQCMNIINELDELASKE